jgi:sigma-B regulation protein RsbQ
MKILSRNNVHVTGHGSTPMIFAHGYGCDQHMWRLVAPAFADEYKIVLYDLTGSGRSDLSAYDRSKYGTLQGHASDLLEICDALDLSKAIVVGHSVSAMTAVLAANREPERFTSLVMVAPSPCYLNDGDYIGGFERADVDGLLDFLDTNFLGWSTKMAPAIMGLPDQPELAEELTNSFCRTDPEIAQHFGRVTFLSNHRADARLLVHPALVMQCSDDIIAPLAVGEWLKRNMKCSELVVMKAKGHCPHLSAPAETIAAMRAFMAAAKFFKEVKL